MPRRQKDRVCNGILYLFILKFILLLICMTQRNTATSVSRRARCAVDCFAKCAFDGIVSKLYIFF